MGVINVLNKNKFLITCLKYLISFVFLFSAVTKIADFQNTLYFFSDIFGTTYIVTKYFLVFLIAFELVLAFIIAIPIFDLKIVYAVTIAFLIFFILIKIGFIYQGINNCGCFGTVWKMKPLTSIIKTMLLIFILLILKNNLKKEKYVA